MRRVEDIALYDRAFAVFFEGRRSTGAEAPIEEPLSITIVVDTDDDSTDGDDGADSTDDEVIELRFSSTEILRHKDFANYSTDELAQAQELMEPDLRLVGAPRASLRRGPTSRRTATPDIRRTVRSAIRAGGEPIERHHLAPDAAFVASCCCSTSADRWSRMRGRCCGSSTPRSPAARRSRPSRSGPG